MLWFYCQRTDSARLRKTEHQLAAEFRMRRIRRIATTCEMIPAGESKGGTRATKFPRGLPPSASAKRFLEHMTEVDQVDDVLARTGIDTSFSSVHNLRLQLATSGFPYLEAL